MQVVHPQTGLPGIEMIYFELAYNTGSWRRVRPPLALVSSCLLC